MSTVGSPWFTGSVMEAVNLSTTKNVIFMVYIHDENEESQQMNNITENPNSAKTIKDKTVALRISHDSEEAKMFGQLFTITKVPSIYLIRVGAVRDYIPGVVSEENLISRINTVASLNLSIPTSLPVSPPVVSSISPSTPSPSAAVAQQSSSSSSSTTSTTAPSNSSFQTQTSENSNDNLISRTERIQSKIEEKRKKKEQEQKRAEKEREINRRTQGKAMQDVYRQQNEAKTKKIADEFAKQRRDDEEAKRRIREQIALDKAERQAKRQAELSLRQQLQQQEEEEQEIFNKIDKVEIINGSYNHSNISVRLLNGDIVRKKFQSTQTLEDVKTWIEEDRTDGHAPYNLIQNFPHRQFGINDETKSLKELNLCPSGTLICKPSKNVSIAYSSDGGFVWNFFALGFSMIGTLLSYINPFYYFYSGNNQQQRRQFENSDNERHVPNNNSNQSDNHNNNDIINNNNNNNSSSSSKSSERRKYGGNNVRTLSQNDDDIDKRWTYNGNSTNQE